MNDAHVQPASWVWDRVAWGVLAVALAIVCLTFRDYGVAWDEQGEVVFGELLLDYYQSGLRDHAAFDFVNFRFYGAGFELPAALLTQVSAFGVYATRHLLSALIGLCGLLMVWRITRRLGGARAGLFALLLLALNPAWYGHSFINARDIPFATGMLCCLWCGLRAIDELPTIRPSTAVGFGLALGWTISVRVGGVMALGLMAVPIALWWIARVRLGLPPRMRDGLRPLTRDGLRILGALLLTLLVAYGVIAVCWPWSVQSPLNPWIALQQFAAFPYDGSVLFDGRVIAARALPASYLPRLLMLSQPESLLLGGVMAVVLGLRFVRDRWPRWLDLLQPARLHLILIATAAFAPIVGFMITRPVAYNGMRHFLFVVPPLTVLAALAFDHLLRAARSRWLHTGIVFALATAALTQTRALIALHPNQYVYFNALIGGPRGAHARYELDYWGTSLAEATAGLIAHIERNHSRTADGPWKVHVCGNVWSAATYFPPWLTAVDRLQDADYLIAIDAFYCHPPADARRIVSVQRAGASLSYVDQLRP